MEKCKYCEIVENTTGEYIIESTDGSDTGVYIFKDINKYELIVNICSVDIVEINFCPICGRKLDN